MHGVVTTSLVPVRAEPDHRAEMVDQYLFGEPYQVVGEKAGWVHVRSEIDGHPGWIEARQVVPLEHPLDEYLRHAAVAGELVQLASTGLRDVWVPAGALLPYFDRGAFKLGKEVFRYQGRIFQPNDVAAAVYELLEAFLGAPYLWGGKTLMGIDCSGLTQVIYRAIGIFLPRNASQQAQLGQPVPLNEAQVGDLVFASPIDEATDRITHVAIVVRPGRVIHASGTVHLAGIDERGIYHLQTHDYTHRFRFVRRMMTDENSQR